MAHPIDQQLSEEDYQLLNANRLGTPLTVYKVKPIYIYILRASSIFFLVLGLGELTLLIVPGRYETQQVDGYVFFAMFVGLLIVTLLAGILILRVELPRVQKQHIIVCEQGLLQIKEKPRDRQIEVVHWRDILTIRRLYDGYYITQRGREAFTLDILYQNVKELVTLIKARSGKIQ